MNKANVLLRLRPVGLAVLLLLGVWALAWLVLPVWLKGFAQDQGRALLGREVHIQSVSFRPWTLELEVQGLQVAGTTADAPPLFELARLYVDAELQSLLRFAPVVDALEVERPVLRLRHLGGGRYDIDDLLERWAQRPQGGEAASWGLFNLALSDGQLMLDDVPAGTAHTLRGLVVTVPFLSNLPTQRDVRTEPRVAFELNGSQFDTRLSTLPFAETRATEATLSLRDLDLAPYLPYWPQALPWRPQQARVQAELTIAFEQRQVPVVQLAGSVTVRDMVLEQVSPAGQRTSGGQPLLSWDSLSLVLADSRPLERRLHMEHMTVQAPRLHLSRRADGRLNLADLTPAQASDPTAAAKPEAPAPVWDIRLGRLALNEGVVLWRDAAVSPTLDTELDALNLSTGALSWPVMAPTQVEASARWLGASFIAGGQVSPFQADVDVRWRDVALQAAAPYVDQLLTLPLRGRSAGNLKLRWQAAGAAGAQPLVAQPLLQVQLQDLTLQDLVLGAQARPAVALRELRLHNGAMDMIRRTADLGQVSVDRPVLHMARDAAGRWMWSDWRRLPANDTPGASSVPANPSAGALTGDAANASGEVDTPWRLGWQGLQVIEGSGRFDDAATVTPVGLRWSALRVQLGAGRSDGVRDAPLSLAAQLAAAGQEAAPGSLTLVGRIGLSPASASAALEAQLSARVTLSRLPMHALVPYVADRVKLDLQRADTSWRGDIALSQAATGFALRAAGDLAVDDLRALDASEGAPLLDWKSLQVRGLQLVLAPAQPLQLSVAETTLSDYFARIDIDPAGRINLQDLLRAPAGGPVTSAAAASTAAPSVGPSAQLSLGPMALLGGNIDFSDRFIRPNYSARLSQVTGSMGAFSNLGAADAEPARVSLRGRVQGTGALDIEGRVNPLLSPPVLDISGKVRELELPPLSTYSLKYTGHGIERGQLSVDVRYQVDDKGQLQASNQLTLNRLVFGERSPDSEAPNLPVRLAVALLADRQGVIDINLPISGSLNDPEFRLGPLIGRLIIGLIGKAVTAPFALLGGLLGSGDAQHGQIEFVPGTDRFREGAAAALTSMGKALTERPGLQLTVVGHSDVGAEREALQRERLRQAVWAEQRRQMARAAQGAVADAPAGAATLPVEDGVVAPADYATLLREVYRRSEVPKPRNAVGLLKDLSVTEMEALLLTHQTATDEALSELAMRRAVRVKERLVADGLTGSRVFVEVAKPGANAPGPRVDLKLSVP